MAHNYLSTHTFACVTLLLLSTVLPTHAWYVPGGTKVTYKTDVPEEVPVRANKLTSMRTAVPYSFYKLPFCGKDYQPKDYSSSQNLGQHLDGDRSMSSAYTIVANQDQACTVLTCHPPLYTIDELSQLSNFINTEYRAQMLLDDLPIAQQKMYKTANEEVLVYELGYPLGNTTEDGEYYIYNHLDITVQYFNESGMVQVVGFLVQPHSVEYSSNALDACSSDNPQIVTASQNRNITWSYSVQWVSSPTTWNQRWAIYFPPTSPELHWVTVTYSLVIAIGLAGFIAVILLRILRTQNAIGRTYGQLDDTSYTEDTGWKALHGDVFRPPPRFMIFSVLVGAGAQALVTSMFIILLSALGFLSPAISGSRTTAIVTVYVLTGIVAGFASARVYILMGGTRKRRNAVLTAFGVPGVIFIVWFITDIALWSAGSSAGPSFLIMLALFGMWFGLMTPLVFLGCFLAHKRYGSGAAGDKYPFPTHTNQIPRMIPGVLWYMNPYVLMMVLGILPFGTVFNELFFMLNAMWSHHIFYLYGVVLLVFVLLVVIIAEVAVVLCYFQLSNEDYHWWWRSMLFPGVTVSYILTYTLFYFGFSLRLAWFSSVVVFLGYTLILGVVMLVLMGTVAFFACLLFVFKIYSTLHVE